MKRVIALAGIIGWGQLSRRAPEVAEILAATVLNPLILMAVEVASILVIWLVMRKWIASRDTYQLID